MKRWQRTILLGALLVGLCGGQAYAQKGEETKRIEREIGESRALLNWMKRGEIYASVGQTDALYEAILKSIDGGSTSQQPYFERYLAWLRNIDADVHGGEQTPMPGAVTSFFVSFPYECASVLDFGQAYLPEREGFDTSKATEGAMYPALNWMLYESVGNLGAIMPQERMYHPGFSVMYLTARIVIDDPENGEMAAGLGEKGANSGEKAAGLGEKGAGSGEMAAGTGEKAAHSGGKGAKVAEKRAKQGKKGKVSGDSTIDAWIEMPSVSPIVAWVNGKRVYEQVDDCPEDLPIFGERRAIKLHRGENILTIKVAALETQPGFYAFLTDAKTGKPLSFEVRNDDAIVVADPLERKISSTSVGSIFSPLERGDKSSIADRAYLARLSQSPLDAGRIVNNLLLNDIEATAKLPVPDLALAILMLQDPGKSLQILRKAMAHRPADGVIHLLYARELVLNSESQGDSGSRFVDEWPEIRSILQKQAPESDGISYEPLRAKLRALSELNAHQAMTALQNMDFTSCTSCESSLLPLVVQNLESRGKIIQYRDMLEKLYSSQKNSAVYFVERLDRRLRRAISSGDGAVSRRELLAIQGEIKQFLERHPYDDHVWEFWLDIVTAYGQSFAQEMGSSADAADRGSRAPSTPKEDPWIEANAEEEFLVYLTQRMNDPARWLRFARWSMETGNLSEAVPAYEMAARLVPQDDSLAERAEIARRLANRDAASDDAASAYEAPYIVKDIPGNTSPDATQFVSLLDNRVVKILPNGLASTFNQIAFEVLDEQGLKTLRAMPINYSPTDEKLEIISVITTKKDGTKHRLYKTTEYNTADESIRMYYDQRQIVIEIPDLAVGDRIEYRFKRTQMQKSASSTNYFSDLYQLQATFPRQWSKYTVITPESFPVRFYLSDPKGNSGFVGDTKKEGDFVVTSYEQKATPRLVQEDRMPGITEVAPFVLASSFASWQDVADWFIDLAKPQWRIDEAIQNAVRELTQGIDDPLEKLKKIHSFVVKSTRYVALEFGIHGHKPYPVSQVFERRFGDCKDKASLLKVMLDEAGIETNFVLVRTRRNGDISMELPNAYLFDHAIVYVPQFDMFLDGTAEFSGTRELPPLDQGANVLIIDDHAGYRLTKTPMSKAEDNGSVHRWAFDLTQTDKIPYTDHVTYKGLMAPSYRERYQVESLRHERLESEYAYAIAGSEIDSFEISDVADLEADVSLGIKATTAFSQIVKIEGNTWIVRPGAKISRVAQSFAPSATRQFDLEQIAPMHLTQTVQFILPEGAKAALPDPAALSNAHGQWSIRSTQAGNIVTAEISLSLSESKIAPKDYASYQDFLQSYDRAVNTPYQITVKE